MKTLFKFVAFISLLGAFTHLSCQKELSCYDCDNNKPPLAHAGKDTIIILPVDSVTLDGSASSDPDGTISAWLWTKISGPVSYTFNNAAASKTVVKNLAAGVYQFELKVTDNGGLPAKDTVMVIIDSAVTTNHTPMANAGKDTIIVLPITTVTLDGSASADPDNNISEYLWTKISGPSLFNLNNTNEVQTPVTNLEKGVYLFELKVTDAGGLFSKDTMQVIVNGEAEVIINCGNLSQKLIGALSIQRSPVSILTAGNKVVFAGGFAGSVGPPLYGASSRVDIYDRSAKSWSTADLSITRFHIGTIASGNKIYFAGGDNGHPCSRVDIYDASNNTWSTAELSEAREAVIAVAAGNKVLFAGGFANTGISNKVDIYDQSNSTWSTATLTKPTSGSYPFRYEIEQSGVISTGNKIYFITGNNNIDVYDALANTWSTLSNNPNQLWGARNVSTENKIYYSGSANFSTYSNTMEIYDIATGSWSSTDMLQKRSDMSVVAADDKIFWAGGEDSSYQIIGEEYLRALNNIEIYDINTGVHSIHNLQQQALWIKTLKTGNKVFFTSGNGFTEIYDINSHSWSICNSYFGETTAIGNTVYYIGYNSSQVWELEF